MAVAVSILASWIAGFVWFKVLFPQPPERPATVLSPFSASLLQHIGDVALACVFAWVMARAGMQSVGQGILLAITIWIGFVAAVLGHMYAFRAFSLRFFFITAGSVLISLLIMGTIIGALSK